METPPPPPAEGASAPGPTMGAAAQKAGEAMAAESRKSAVEIKKLVVAIHGIGDQYRKATIQTVVTCFGRHFDFPATVPLGSFYAAPGEINAFTLKAPPQAPAELAGIGFVEAYWADIPRRIQQRGYTIEESKAWARTIVDRVRARYGSDAGAAFDFQPADFRLAAGVLEEMVDTIAVLGNLLFLAEKAGLFKFDLDALLTSYLGDVQVVADFANYRARILAQFHEVLEPVYQALTAQQAAPEIYIIAHSEGTVIAFMALLQAMRDRSPGQQPPLPPRPAWIETVRGFMTIGSPIDKHLVLFPAIWDAVQAPGRAPDAGPIHWHNYYDFGDPIGFELGTTREWLRDPGHDWESIGAFQFRDPDAKGAPRDDFGFSRYLLPGAAHNDYWTDQAVFGHFIQTVMGLPPEASLREDYSQAPRSRLLAKICSYLIPYLLIAATLYTGVYLLFKGLRGFLANEIARAAADDCLLILWIRNHCGVPAGAANALLDLVLNVTGISCLLAGMTLLARIPRLTRSARWQWIAVLLFAGFAGLYVLLVDAQRRSWLGFHAVGDHFQPGEAWAPTAVTLGLALFTSLLSVLGGRRHAPAQLQPLLRGMKPLLVPGVLSVVFIVGFRLVHADRTATHSLWPLLLSGAAFTYLWWLAGLLFDLVFVWQRYIRFATFQYHLRKLRPLRKAREKKEWEAQQASSH